MIGGGDGGGSDGEGGDSDGDGYSGLCKEDYSISKDGESSISKDGESFISKDGGGSSVSLDGPSYLPCDVLDPVIGSEAPVSSGEDGSQVVEILILSNWGDSGVVGLTEVKLGNSMLVCVCVCMYVGMYVCVCM